MRYLLFVVAFTILLLPQAAQAATADFFGPIIPEICKCDGVYQTPDGKTLSSAPAYGCILQTVQNVIKFAISLAIVFATLALIYAGFVWITARGKPEQINQGKTLLMNVFIGLVVMLGAWLFVDFIMKTLYSEPTGFGPWNSILAGSGDSANGCIDPNFAPSVLTSGTATLKTNGLQVVGGGSSAPGASYTVEGTVDNEKARSLFKDNGITVAASTLANTRLDTINQVIRIKSACNCNVVVTSTTGGSHADGVQSHASGYKVDLDDTADLNRFLESTLTRSGVRTGANGGPRYLDGCGNEYVKEDTHWDIKVSNGACSLGR